MDVNTIQTKKPPQSKESKDHDTECTRLQAEERCYKCKQQGHVKKECPDWKKQDGKLPPYKPKARTTTVDQVKEADKEDPDNLKDLACHMALLDVQKKEDLFNIIMEEPGF
jgi:hypothetical protein